MRRSELTPRLVGTAGFLMTYSASVTSSSATVTINNARGAARHVATKSRSGLRNFFSEQDRERMRKEVNAERRLRRSVEQHIKSQQNDAKHAEASAGSGSGKRRSPARKNESRTAAEEDASGHASTSSATATTAAAAAEAARRKRIKQAEAEAAEVSSEADVAAAMVGMMQGDSPYVGHEAAFDHHEAAMANMRYNMSQMPRPVTQARLRPPRQPPSLADVGVDERGGTSAQLRPAGVGVPVDDLDVLQPLSIVPSAAPPGALTSSVPTFPDGASARRAARATAALGRALATEVAGKAGQQLEAGPARAAHKYTTQHGMLHAHSRTQQRDAASQAPPAASLTATAAAGGAPVPAAASDTPTTLSPLGFSMNDYPARVMDVVELTTLQALQRRREDERPLSTYDAAVEAFLGDEGTAGATAPRNPYGFDVVDGKSPKAAAVSANAAEQQPDLRATRDRAALEFLGVAKPKASPLLTEEDAGTEGRITAGKSARQRRNARLAALVERCRDDDYATTQTQVRARMLDLQLEREQKAAIAAKAVRTAGPLDSGVDETAAIHQEHPEDQAENYDTAEHATAHTQPEVVPFGAVLTRAQVLEAQERAGHTQDALGEEELQHLPNGALGDEKAELHKLELKAKALGEQQRRAFSAREKLGGGTDDAFSQPRAAPMKPPGVAPPAPTTSGDSLCARLDAAEAPAAADNVHFPSEAKTVVPPGDTEPLLAAALVPELDGATGLLDVTPKRHVDPRFAAGRIINRPNAELLPFREQNPLSTLSSAAAVLLPVKRLTSDELVDTHHAGADAQSDLSPLLQERAAQALTAEMVYKEEQRTMAPTDVAADITWDTRMRRMLLHFFQRHPMNEMIDNPIAVIIAVQGADGDMVRLRPVDRSIVPIEEARKLAQEHGLDLIKLRNFEPTRTDVGEAWAERPSTKNATPVTSLVARGTMNPGNYTRNMGAVCVLADHVGFAMDHVEFFAKLQAVRPTAVRPLLEVGFRGGTHDFAIRFKTIAVAKFLFQRFPVRLTLTDFGTPREGFPVFERVLQFVQRECERMKAYCVAGQIRAASGMLYCYIHPSTVKAPLYSVEVAPTQEAVLQAMERAVLDEQYDREVTVPASIPRRNEREYNKYQRMLADGSAWQYRSAGLGLAELRALKVKQAWLPKSNRKLWAKRGDVELDAPFRGQHLTATEAISFPRESNLQQAERGASVLKYRAELSITDAHDLGETPDQTHTLYDAPLSFFGDAIAAGDLKTNMGLKRSGPGAARPPRYGPGFATLGVKHDSGHLDNIMETTGSADQ